MDLEIENMNNIGIKNNIEKEKNISNKQNEFLDNLLSEVIDSAIDAGIKYLLPKSISKDIINLKNKIFTKRFKTELKNTIDKVIRKGKREIGRTDISLRNIKEVHQSLYRGNILDNVSNLIKKYVEEKKDLGKIDSKTSKKIIDNEGVLMQNISTNIENELINQMRDINILRKYNFEWKKAFEIKNLEEMRKIYIEIEKKLLKVLPIKNILNDIEKIKIIQKILDENNGDFKMAEEEFLRLKEMA